MFKNKLQKRHHKMDQPGFKKRLFPTFFCKSRGHFQGSDFQPFVILARVPVDFKVVFGRLFSDIWKWSKMVENASGAECPGSAAAAEGGGPLLRGFVQLLLRMVNPPGPKMSTAAAAGGVDL